MVKLNVPNTSVLRIYIFSAITFLFLSLTRPVLISSMQYLWYLKIALFFMVAEQTHFGV